MTEKEELFIAILSGTAAPAERDLFSTLMEQDENRIAFDQTKRIWDESAHVKKYHQADAKKGFARLVQKIKEKDRIRKKYLTISLVSAAAGILLMTGLFTLYGSFFNKTYPGSSILVRTEQGNRSSVVLPDSTRVWLNSKSVIRYPAGFGNGNRKVVLTGEAFFDVAHSDQPFIVSAGEFEIRVHGTRFNVSNYPDDGSIYTCLESGSISISSDAGKDLQVEPGQLVVYDRKTNNFKISSVNPREYSSWRQNEMYLHAESLGLLATKLERKYNVEIVFIPKELAEKVHYTGVFTDENIEEILNAISIASDLTYTKKGSRYEIR
ncbi:MAG: FecR domain-containing protein [Prolixibacteraceae bacterium]